MSWNYIFNYQAGKLYWKVKPSKKVKIGDIAGTINGAGYIEITFNKGKYLAHRIIWEMHNGTIPIDMEVDHSNHNRCCNLISNLNLVTHTQNQRNQSKSIRNKSGFTGVTWKKDRNKWHSQIHVNGKNLHIGFFDRIEDAIDAREKANLTHQYHPNHGL